MHIDLNCDLGESTEPAQVAADLALLSIVTSASIACGGHAGDESTMAATVEAALLRGVAIGAHPGYPDRASFGRIALDMTPDQVEATVFQQVAALDRLTRAQGGRLAHVKLHGALYHKAMHDEPTARAIAAAVQRTDPSLFMVAMPGTAALHVWRGLGFTVATEFFADRGYEPSGALRPRSQKGALITDPAAAAEQAVRLVGNLPPADGPFTLCIHSDTPHAVMIAAAVRAGLEKRNLRVATTGR